nr:hypothetical protein [Streptomyces tsukubensis NRRL18488]
MTCTKPLAFLPLVDQGVPTPLFQEHVILWADAGVALTMTPRVAIIPVAVAPARILVILILLTWITPLEIFD